VSKTTWTVEHDRTLGQIRFVLESTDPAMIRRVEAAAKKSGIELLRLPGGDEKLEPGEPDPRD
jgi:hypothetical protein